MHTGQETVKVKQEVQKIYTLRCRLTVYREQREERARAKEQGMRGDMTERTGN